MSSQSYEIELVASSDSDYLVSLLATVTGLPKDEIAGKLPEHLQGPGGWRGQSFVEVARVLGYNVNPQFKPFQARTPWPCILRVQEPGKYRWWALAYANGQVYDPWREEVLWFDDFVRRHPEVHIRSMLQIWIP